MSCLPVRTCCGSDDQANSQLRDSCVILAESGNFYYDYHDQRIRSDFTGKQHIPVRLRNMSTATFVLTGFPRDQT